MDVFQEDGFNEGIMEESPEQLESGIDKIIPLKSIGKSKTTNKDGYIVSVKVLPKPMANEHLYDTLKNAVLNLNNSNSTHS